MKVKKNRAFTLIELMVAISILALLATGLLTAYTSCVLLNLSNINFTKAANNAQSVLEELASAPYSDIVTQTYPAFGNLQNETVTVDVTTTTNKKEVVVEVNWAERGRDNNFKLFTVFYEDE
ncbi:MAG: type II secretion system GspH family protein [Candidatus Omnitrophica bacterium]|nr:type II secretion system GspH family protein [Candidatus Omnitrophota bacterium]